MGIDLPAFLQDRTANICFSGPRPFKLPGGGAPDCPEMARVTGKLRELIQEAAARGKTNFISGFMSGFDIIAAEQVVSLKKELPCIRCVVIAPFRKGYFKTENWTPEWTARAKGLYAGVDFGLSLQPAYSKGAYFRRDDFMIGMSSELICCYNGRGGGTLYTINQAKKQKLQIFQIDKRVQPQALRLLDNR